jgi:glycosyltransferase involved in cell wall biosynthesis
MIEQTRQDLVISNQTKGHLYGGSAARLAKVPAVFWQQGIPSASLMERLAGIVPARCIVASSEAAVKAQRAITPRRRVRRIPLGVLVEQIAHRAGEGAAIREVLGVSGLPTVGIVGRLQPWKGQDLFLRAAAQVAHRAPDVRFLVVGGAILGWEGSYPGDLERSVSESPELRDRVIFAGHQDDVYPWYDALDVVVHASTEEPFGLVLVEAMALGRPLVATGAAGPTEIVEHGVSGLLVPPGDASAMAQAIRSILDDVALARDLSAGAKARSEQFSARSMAARWAALLDEITTPP